MLRTRSGTTSKRCLVILAGAFAIAAAAGGCEEASAPGRSASRAPDVPFEPTPHHVVAEMLKLAQVGANDLVYDLGCGDGRIVIAAVKEFGARGVCVDIDPQRVIESRANAQRAGVAERIRFLNQDLFETEIGDATVVTLFLWPSVNLKLRPKLWRELRPGTRVVSYVHNMGDWPPQESRNVEGARGPRKLFLWVIPAHSEGMREQAPRRLLEERVEGSGADTLHALVFDRERRAHGLTANHGSVGPRPVPPFEAM